MHNHVHGKKLLLALISHLMKQGDVQMAAVLICIFMPTTAPKPSPTLRPVLRRLPLPTPSPPLEASPKSEVNLGKRGRGRRKQATISPKIKISTGSSPSPTAVPTTPPSTEKKQKFWFLGSGGPPPLSSDESNCGSSSHNPYHTVNLGTIAAARKVPRAEAVFSSSFVKSDHSLEHFVTPYLRVSRSNSWTADLAEESQSALSPAIVSEEAFEDFTLSAVKNQSRVKFNVLGDDMKSLEAILNSYADILERWGLIQERAALLKHSTDSSHADSHKQPLSSSCSGCRKRGCGEVQCDSCGAVCLRCAVCTLPVKGMARSCTKCGHGGHFSHWTNWFGAAGVRTCPKAGCGCNCFTK